MWSRNDSGFGMDWSNALAWAQAQNAANYLGYNDWRLPNTKELQTHCGLHAFAGHDAFGGDQSGVQLHRHHQRSLRGGFPVVLDRHDANHQPHGGGGRVRLLWPGDGLRRGRLGGCARRRGGTQRSQRRQSLTTYTHVGNGYYSPLAPQGDAVRIFNYVRLVRDIPATNAWRFAFVGDTHVPLTTVPGEIATAAVGDDARFLIVAGDVAESGSNCSPATLTTQLTEWRTEMAPLSNSGIPVYVIRGNHEDDVPDGLPAWTNFFSGAYSMPSNGPAGEIDLTYSTALTYSNALFVGLDDYVNIHEVNQPWLNQQLAANRLPHLFVYGHEPAFKAFHTDCLGSAPTQRNTFWSSLTAAGAKVYLCGHDHFFNVARIDDGDGNPANDLYQFIVGTGGSTNWPPQVYNYNGTNAPYTPVNLWNITETYGYLLVEISGPGANDLGVTMTWKQRTYDTNTASYIYVATTNVFTYTAVNRQADSVGDGIPDWWRAQYFGGSGATTNATSCATADPDHDGVDNYHEYLAGTNPTNALSYFHIQSISNNATGLTVFYQSSWGRNYTLYSTTNLASGAWLAVPSQTDILGDGGVDALTDSAAATNARRFYRIAVSLP